MPVEDGSQSFRDYSAHAPGVRTPMSTNYFETSSSFYSYVKVTLITVFLLATLYLKCSGVLKRLSFDPRRPRRQTVTNF